MTQNEKLQEIISMIEELRDKRYDRFFFDEEFDDCLNATVEQITRYAEECMIRE